ncbi:MULTISPECIES: DUF4870 domain-containing protein [Pseudomonas]|uniref:Orotate phosphoribosyltransferase n=1 Tax=Pseudomonas fluorescens TaxID=294 RepID=A0A5E6TKX5_PSEFL|nr:MULTISPECIES: DUF4870 domain-containing protein [Pseudomonas]VVM93944.1 hypothetical protein PS652_02936 [Pseudomonas fluorescens]
MTEQPLQLPTPNAEVRQWAMFCHLAALLGLVFPFGSLLGPLVMWIWKKDVDPFVDAQGKEALNFQITVFIASIICAVLMFVLIGVVLFGMLMIAVLILTIMAGVKANDGLPYRYPLTWRPIK